MGEPIWIPPAERVAASNLTRFAAFARERHGAPAGDYAALWRWSVDERERFWTAVMEFAGVLHTPGTAPVLQHRDRMPGAVWFEDTRLNFAENLLARDDDHPALVFCNERGTRRELSYRAAARRGRAGWLRALRELGIGPGDRVAGFVPNLPEAVIAMLATTSLGAAWTSCSPDFGINGVLDRFGQVAPRVLFTADGYFYNGKTIDSLAPVRGVLEQLPSVERVVVIPYVERGARPRWPARRRLRSATSAAPGAAPGFRRVPFDTPLFVMYSSGTTGVPKCIVHGVGRHAAAASQGAPAAHRPHARRPPVLLHDLRLDDVELAGERPRHRLHGGAVRGLAVRAGPRRALAPGRARARHGLRHQPEVPLRAAEGRRRAGRATSTSAPCARSCPPARRSRPSSSTSCTSRSRPTCTSPRSRAAPTSSPASASATPGCRCTAARSSRRASAWRSRSATTRAHPCASSRANSSAPPPSPRCRSASGTTRTARSTVPRISSASRTCGATATTRCRPRTTASSSSAARTPC